MYSEHFPRIKDLWDRRDSLAQPEWAELYQRVLAALGGWRPKEAAALPDKLDDLQHLYFVERVLNGRSRNGPLHVGALRLYFQRFLLDLLRGPAAPPDPEAQAGCELQSGPAYAETLRDYALTPQQVQARAAEFLATLSQDLLLLLRHCGCGGAPVSDLLEQIASAHYRCGQLGLVHSKQGDGNSAARLTALPAHRRTLLGRWVSATLRLDDAAVSERDLAAAQIVLDILCAVALTDHMDPSGGQA